MITRFFTLSVAAAATAAFSHAAQPEPGYGGKTIAAWVKVLGRPGATKADRRDAAWALYMIGPESVPALMTALGSEDREVRADASLALEAIGEDAAPALAKALKSPNEELRGSARSTLVRLGPKAAGAVPTLIELLGAKDALALEVLSNLGPGAKDALPAVAKVLADTDRTGWKNPLDYLGPDRGPNSWAGFALTRLGVTAIPTLTGAFQHPDAGVRRTAGDRLWVMFGVHMNEPPGARARRVAATEWLRGPTPEAKAARTAIIQAVSGSDAEVRYYAVALLAECGPSAKEAVPALVAILEDVAERQPDPQQDRGRLRAAAARTLGHMGPAAEPAVPALAKAWAAAKTDGIPDRVAEEAWHALLNLGEVAHTAADTIIEHSKGRDTLLRKGIAHKVPAFTKALADPNETAARRLEAALLIGGKDPGTAPVLAAAVKTHPEAEVRASAASALQRFAYAPVEPNASTYPGMTEEPWVMLDRLGRADRARARRVPDKLPADGVPALVAALGDKDPAVRLAAADAIAVIGPEAKDATAALVKMMVERAEPERTAAVVALWAVGPDVKTAGPVLEEAMKDLDHAPRRAAAFALARIDPKPERAGPLADVLTAPDVVGNAIRVYHREIAGRELVALGVHARGVVHQLIRSHERADRDWGYTIELDTLTRLGEHAVPGLVEALRGPSAQLRHAAAWIAGRMGPAAKATAPALEAALADEDLAVRFAAARSLLRIDPIAARKLGLR